MSGLRWTPDQLKAHQSRSIEKLKRADAARKRFQALGRLPKGRMNKTEQAYAERLDAMKAAGEIIDWKFHPMNIRLATNAFYEVDFLVLHADMSLAIHETKGGFTTDKGQLKIRMCAEVMPWFTFYKAIKKPKKYGGGWEIQEF